MNQRWEYIDALKGLAMLMVIATHCINNDMPESVKMVLGNGRHGVQIFFVISGLLTAISVHKICFGYGENHLDLKTISHWMLKKLKHIAPVYYFVIFLVIGVNCVSSITGYEYLATYWLGQEKNISIANILTHVFFINGFFPHYVNSIIGVEWYIADLVIFYALYILFFRRFYNRNKTLVGMIVFTIVLSYLLKWLDRHVSIYGFDAQIFGSYINTFNVLAQLPCMLIGGYICRYFTKNITEGEKKYNIFGVIGWVGLLSMLTNVFHITESLMDVMYAMAASLILLGMRNGMFALRSHLLRVIGRYSLEIYLIHIIFIDIWNSYIYSESGFAIVEYLVKYCVIVAISLALAMIMRKCQEWLSVRCS